MTAIFKLKVNGDERTIIVQDIADVKAAHRVEERLIASQGHTDVTRLIIADHVPTYTAHEVLTENNLLGGHV